MARLRPLRPGDGATTRREILAVRHPYVRDSIGLLEGAKGQIYFTHMNHTNPMLDPASPEAKSLPKGFHVLEEGAVFEL